MKWYEVIVKIIYDMINRMLLYFDFFNPQLSTQVAELAYHIIRWARFTGFLMIELLLFWFKTSPFLKANIQQKHLDTNNNIKMNIEIKYISKTARATWILKHEGTTKKWALYCCYRFLAFNFSGFTFLLQSIGCFTYSIHSEKVVVALPQSK